MDLSSMAADDLNAKYIPSRPMIFLPTQWQSVIAWFASESHYDN